MARRPDNSTPDRASAAGPAAAGRRRWPRRRAGAGREAEPTVADYRAALEIVTETCVHARRGDLEHRVPPLPASLGLDRLRHELNGALDAADAFVRESTAALAAVAERRYHRLFLVQGMQGSYRSAASAIDGARRAMADSAEVIEAQDRSREQVAQAVMIIAEQVATVAAELMSSAEVLGQFTDTATEIEEASALITSVAAETRQLALNATIEAVRAGEYGRGFAVVAGEVKRLSANTELASVQIARELETATRAATASAQAVARISAVIASMQDEVQRCANAAAHRFAATN